MAKNHILIVDDERRIRSSLASILIDEGYLVSTAEDGLQAIEMIKRDTPDLVMLDIWMPDKDGLDILKWIKTTYPDLGVIMISGHGNIETAVKSIKLGAYDFIEKPLSLEKSVFVVNKALEKIDNKTIRKRMEPRNKITGKSQAVHELKKLIAMAAPSNGWVLITGENGTGKELVAREIHFRSPRRDKPFVGVNCAAIPEDLIESELFGHEKGAFTGATRRHEGKFEIADGGTIFLDEVGDMSLKTQAKLLRALQEHNFQRVGGSETIDVDVRVIAASNKNLGMALKSGEFREDFFYRLNVIPIDIKPLRERKEDIPLLVEYFLEEFSSKNGVEKKKVTEEALEIFYHYEWPGNVRELKNLTERLVIMTVGPTIAASDIPDSYKEKHGLVSFKEAKQDFEKYYIRDALEKSKGNISNAARNLKIERSLLYQKIKKLGISIDDFMDT
ncbi:MAG: sigma-54-dependent transcriptional regulator [bacterium]